MGIKTKIDWCDSSWSPVTGCLHGCEYCYARRIAERFGGYDGATLVGQAAYMYAKTLDQAELVETWEDVEFQVWSKKDEHGQPAPCAHYVRAPYPFGFKPTFHRELLDVPQTWKKPRTIFVCSMADLFGEWVPDEWIDSVIKSTQKALQHRYLFLTKNPERYDDFLERFEESKIDGLDEISNCWFGASATDNKQLQRANESRAIWLSIEPIKERIETDENQFMEFVPCSGGETERARWAWVVIGAETGNSKNKVQPKKEWIDDIVKECKEYGTPVFMKESLRGIMGADFVQEFPWEVSKNA